MPLFQVRRELLSFSFSGRIGNNIYFNSLFDVVINSSFELFWGLIVRNIVL